MGSLPHSRPARRSEKRAPRPAQATRTKPAAPPKHKRRPEQTRRPKQPSEQPPEQEEAQRAEHDAARERPRVPRAACPGSLADGAELVGTALKAAVELAEIGLTVSAHALRIAVSRLPKP